MSEFSINAGALPGGVFRHEPPRPTGGGGTPTSPSLPSSLPRRWNWRKNIFPDAIAEYDYEAIFRRSRYQRRCMLVWSLILVMVVVIALSFSGSGNNKVASSFIVKNEFYEVMETSVSPEIDATLVLYRHKRTGAEVLTIIPDDLGQDSVFGVSINTLSDNNAGAAHVVMNAVMDGSNAFPFMDPLNEYKKGSLQTYLKSECLEDRTTFTAASLYSSDFINLMTVMLDGIFKPTFIQDGHEYTFREEAWRLEPTSIDLTVNNPTDIPEFTSNSTLRFNGIVWNEQRSVYNDPDETIHRYARRSLFGDTNYQYDAQGVPEDIHTLTRDEVIQFYKKYYHPSNARIFLEGDIYDIYNGLDIFNDYAGGYKKHSHIASKPKWQENNMPLGATEIHAFPSQEDDGIYQIMVTWIINDKPMNTKTEYAWKMIEYLMLGTQSSSFAPLITWGTEIIGGLDTTYQQWTFSVGIKGVFRDYVNQVEEEIFNGFRDAVESGFSTSGLSAAKHLVALKRRDYSSGDKPRGVLLFQQALEKWTYGNSPTQAYAFSKGYRDLLNDMGKNGDKFLLDLIDTNILKNNHHVNVHLFPRRDEVEVQQKQEMDQLELMLTSMPSKELTQILFESRQFYQVSSTPTDPDKLATLPSIAISEIVREEAKDTAYLAFTDGLLVSKTNVESSFGLLYVDLGIDLREVDFDQVSLLPLLYRLMVSSGTGKWDKESTTDHLGWYSEGIEAESMILDVRKSGFADRPMENSVHDGENLVTKVVFRGACLADKLFDYLGVLKEIVFDGAGFDKVQVVGTIESMIDEFQVKMGAEGHVIAAHRLEARYSYHGIIEEQLHGLTQLKSLHRNVIRGETDFESLLLDLETVRDAIVRSHRGAMFLSVVGQEQLMEQAEDDIHAFAQRRLPKNENATPLGQSNKEVHPWVTQIKNKKDAVAPMRNEAILVETPVDYIGMAGRLYDINAPVDGSAAVFAKYLERAYLYSELHEKRGAAKVYASVNYRHGTLQMLSYEDPHLAASLELLDGAPEALSKLVMGESGGKLPAGAHEAIVGAIADMDGMARQPNQVGWDYVADFYRQDVPGFQQAWRDQILNTTFQGFKNVVDAFLVWDNPSAAMVISTESYQAFKNMTDMPMSDICEYETCLEGEFLSRR